MFPKIPSICHKKKTKSNNIDNCPNVLCNIEGNNGVINNCRSQQTNIDEAEFIFWIVEYKTINAKSTYGNF